MKNKSMRELVQSRLARLDTLEKQGKRIKDTTMLRAFQEAVLASGSTM